MSTQLEEATKAMPKWRILVVENDPQTRADHIYNLQRWGYQSFAARGQGQALLSNAEEMAKEERCHLALVDMRLLSDDDSTDIRGLDLVPVLKPAESIVVTGFADKPRFARMATEKGALAIVGKEEGPVALHEIIVSILQKCGYRGIDIDWQDALNELRVARHLFPENPSLFKEEAKDLLRRLFPDVDRLHVTLLDTTDDPLSLTLRPGSLVVKVTRGGDNLPYLVKIGRGKRTTQEVSNYNNHVHMKSSGQAPVAPLNAIELWTLGGTVYYYLGNFIRQRPTLFSDWYKAPEREVTDISKALEELYTQWGPHYHQRTGASKLIVAYNQVWDKDKDIEKRWLFKLVSGRELFSKIQLPPPLVLLGLPNPVDWLITKLTIDSKGNFSDPTTQSTNISITHGDMHGDNFFVTRDSDVWVIDFERTGGGPVLQDWIELEHDILTRLTLLHPEEWCQYARLIRAIAKPDMVGKWSSNEDTLSDTMNHPQADKALKAIDKIRCLAKQSDEEASEDARSYVWGLLLNAVFRLMIWQGEYDEPRLPQENLDKYEMRREKLYNGVQRCFVLASILCHRLDHWNKKWPPREWKAILQVSSEKDPVPKSPAPSDFSYDVFISYSPEDRSWVHSELLQRLEAAKLRVCVDFRDFQLGASSITEMERAVKTSRRTLAVLTPRYSKSDWATFEQLMTATLDPANQRRRFIPALKEKCEIPLRIKYLTYVDFTDPDNFDLSWKRLLEALVAPLDNI